MKKFISARFALELIIEDGKEPDLELRDVNGMICSRGDFSSISDFLKEVYDQFLKQKSNISVEK